MTIFHHTIASKEIWNTTTTQLVSIGELTTSDARRIEQSEGFEVFVKGDKLYSSSFGALVHLRSYPESTQFPKIVLKSKIRRAA